MKRRLNTLFERIDALGRRDRMALLGGALAALIGLEFTVVQPMADKRQLMTQALAAEAQSQADTLAAERTARGQQLASARQRVADVDARLARMGLRGDGRENLATFLAQLGQRGVTLAGVRGLPVASISLVAPGADGVQPVSVPVFVPISAPVAAPVPSPADVAGAVAGGVVAAATATGAPSQLYQHRTELILQGSVGALAQAIEGLERHMAPLRVERVRVAPPDASNTAATAQVIGAEIRATVVMTTITSERTWIGL